MKNLINDLYWQIYTVLSFINFIPRKLDRVADYIKGEMRSALQAEDAAEELYEQFHGVPLRQKKGSLLLKATEAGLGDSTLMLEISQAKNLKELQALFPKLEKEKVQP